MAGKQIGLTLDSGALIAAEKNDRRFWIFWKSCIQRGLDISVPATVLAQVWRDRNNLRMAMVLKACGVDALTEASAKASGELCGRAGSNDIVDSHVVLSAYVKRYDVVTSDPDDLKQLASFLDEPPLILDLRLL